MVQKGELMRVMDCSLTKVLHMNSTSRPGVCSRLWFFFISHLNPAQMAEKRRLSDGLPYLPLAVNNAAASQGDVRQVLAVHKADAHEKYKGERREGRRGEERGGNEIWFMPHVPRARKIAIGAVRWHVWYHRPIRLRKVSGLDVPEK
jgi:hypothetical protein